MTLTAGRRSDHDTRVGVDADPASQRHGTMGCVQGARPSLRRTAATVLATADRGERYVAMRKARWCAQRFSPPVLI
jgi:hypothetical protein